MGDTTKEIVKTIAIATWGNPWRYLNRSDEMKWNWREVTYAMDIDGGEEHVENVRTTLPLIKKVYKYDEAIVLVQESVLFNIDVNSYDDVERSVQDLFRGFVEDLGKGGLVEPREVTIHVMPAVGRFRNMLDESKKIDVEICGSISDYHRMAHYVIARELVKHAEEVARHDGELHIVLDLTHGVNYTPTLTYDAVRYIVGLLAWFIPIRLKVVNSEPVTEAHNKYYVHVVEDMYIPTTTEIYGISQGRFLATNERCIESESEKGVVGQEISRRLESLSGLSTMDLNAFLGSFANGVPLSAILLQPDYKALEGDLEKIVNAYKKDLTYVGRGIRIVHRARIRGDFLGLTSAWLLARMLNSIGFSRKNYMLFSEVKELSKRVFNRNEKFKALISRDIDEIDKLKGRIKAPGLLFRFLNGKEDKVGDCIRELIVQEQLFERNFLAHSGFERCITIVKPHEKEDIILGYAYISERLDNVDPELAKRLSEELKKKKIKEELDSYVPSLIKSVLSKNLIHLEKMERKQK